METRKLLQLFIGPPLYNYEWSYFKEYEKYIQNQMQTKIPSFINERHVLHFDSNFESGNLDSAFLVQENEYNLLMKVDTNTKGNSFWFYFRVSNARPNSTIKFNILNFSRDLKLFYQQGMNIMTLK